MNRITFFTRPECMLCDSALFVVEKVRRKIPFDLEIVDISATGQEKWLTLYKNDIPVVHFNEVEIFRHRVDEKKLRQTVSQRPT